MMMMIRCMIRPDPMHDPIRIAGMDAWMGLLIGAVVYLLLGLEDMPEQRRSHACLGPLCASRWLGLTLLLLRWRCSPSLDVL